MNDANNATYDTFNLETRLDSEPGRFACTPRKSAADRTLYAIAAKDCAENQSVFQVEEDQGAYILDFLTDEHYDANPEAHAAAADHARHLRKAERLLDEAVNLVKLLLASLADECDSRAMQTETALQVIEKKLNSAHSCVDKHDTRHTRLFLAYADLKREADAGKTS